MSAWEVYKHLRETGDFERVMQAIDTFSRRQESTQVNSRETTIDGPPKSIDGRHYRYKLVHGGYLIEVLEAGGRLSLYYEPPGGDRVELIIKPLEGV